MTNKSKLSPFHYYSGESVKKGDLVKTAYGNQAPACYRYGFVEKIIAPDSEDSIYWNCPQGGVLVVEDWDGNSNSVLWTPPDGIYWEDLEFIQRGEE